MRKWTKEELDSEHPWSSPADDVDGDDAVLWEWEVTSDGRPLAVGEYDDGEGRCEQRVSVWRGQLVSMAGDYGVSVPVSVAAAVLLASYGHDSLATMVNALIAMSTQLEAEALTHESHGDRETACARAGEAVGLRVAATILQRGRVKP